jgi:hypothetical protein
MYWTELLFGRHWGKTLPQLAFIDPGYLFWAMDEGVFNRYGLRGEARMVCLRATHIRIPQRAGENLVAEYTFSSDDGRFVYLELVPESSPVHQGSGSKLRLPVFSLHVTRTCCTYDKAGGRALVNALKYHLFGSENYRLTKEHCEKFLEDDANFVLPVKSQGSVVAKATREADVQGGPGGNRSTSLPPAPNTLT